MKLGDVVRDKITGLTGVAISRTEWLNGCVRWGIQPRVLYEGKPVDPQHFDEQQLELAGEPSIVIGFKPTGGDRPDPVRAPDPR